MHNWGTVKLIRRIPDKDLQFAGPEFADHRVQIEEGTRHNILLYLE